VLPFVGSEQKESIRETKNLSLLHLFLLPEFKKGAGPESAIAASVLLCVRNEE